MLTAAICLFTVGMDLPSNPSFDYSGVPSLPGVALKSHGVQIDMSKDKTSTVTSTTVFKNESTAPVTVTLTIPRRRVGDDKSGNPTFTVDAKWDNLPMTLAMPAMALSGEKIGPEEYFYKNDLTKNVTFKAGQTSSLKISYTLPFGRCGYEQKQKMTGYAFDTSNMIGLLSISYRYGGPTVFHLPEAFPKDWGWQIGTKGAFVRKENFKPSGELTYITFYPGGFDNIGGGKRGGGGGGR
ncbi:MAG: hypothetical protein KF784_09165 [Fimbriimonadaceae bacterium]|nr:hypothetical protein [Fimbriimonadaceae bacterium]